MICYEELNVSRPLLLPNDYVKSPLPLLVVIPVLLVDMYQGHWLSQRGIVLCRRDSRSPASLRQSRSFDEYGL